jgi:hypothetical protein
LEDARRKTKTTTGAILLFAALMMATVGLTSGCGDGPAEEVGEEIDEAARKAEDAIDPPGPAEKAGRKMDEALDDD